MKNRLFALAALSFSCVAFAQSEVRDSLEYDRAGAFAVEDLLTGHISGVRTLNTGEGLNVLRNVIVRGTNMTHGSGGPLFIVDGAVLSSINDEQIDMFWQDSYKDKTVYNSLSELDALNLYDIESISVLKSASATALYGELGANGVIIISTKRPKQERSVELRSNFGSDFPGFVSQNSVALSSGNQRTKYRLSAFFRNAAVSSTPERNLNGGAAFSLNTLAGKNAEIGLSARVGIGEQLSGSPMENSSDFEDKSQNIRTIESAWFNMKILDGFYWRTRLSADFQTHTRTIWYGADTQFGGEVNNAAGISLASKLLATARTSFDFNRYFASNHFLNISVGGEVLYSDGKYNTINGTNILVTQLKAQGFGYRESEDESALFRNNIFRGNVFVKASYDYKKITGVDLLASVGHTRKYESNWNFYPSATVWLDIKKLALEDSMAVSALRLQGDFGITGLNRFVPYYMFPKYTQEDFPVHPKDMWAFIDGWQAVRSREYNVSVNAGFLGGRFNVLVGYYNRSTVDNLLLYNNGVLDESSNLWKYGERTEDAKFIDKIKSQGVELDFDGRVFNSKNFIWDIGLHFAWNRFSPQLSSPEIYGGLSSSFRFYGVTIDLLADGVYGGGFEYLRLARATCGYDIPIPKVKWIQNLSVHLSWYDSVRKSLVFGIKADF